MTLEELKSLRHGEVVVFIKVDERICEFHNHQVGDEMTFIEFEDAYKIGATSDVVNFLRNNFTISHFSYEIFNYIERKVLLERDNKLNDLGL